MEGRIEAKPVRVRIAPSPTGYPHIGTIYQALFNYAYAQKHTGEFIVRIEDTDRARFVEDAEENIFHSLDWVGLTEDESPRKGGPFEPYRQSERLPIYQKYAKELVDNGKAYYCFCTKERLDELRKTQQASKQIPRYDKFCLTQVTDGEERIKNGEPYVIRLNVTPGKRIWFDDMVRGRIEFESDLIDDQVLIKSDGYPTYHLGVVVDDHLMEISHVVRGEEWIPSTPKHIILYESFGWELPKFCHTSDLRNPDRSKLSKRHGHTNINWYREEGYLPEALLNYLALLGWSHPEEKEIFTLAEFIKTFDLKDISPVGPIFDLVKLTWMNQQYIQNLSDEALLEKLMTFTPSLQSLDQTLLRKIMPLVKTRMNTLKEFTEATAFFFGQQAVVLTAEEKEIGKKLLSALQTCIDWNADSVFAVFKELMTTEKIRMPLLYKIITGKERGLPLPESLAILGKEKTLAILEHNLT